MISSLRALVAGCTRPPWGTLFQPTRFVAISGTRWFRLRCSRRISGMCVVVVFMPAGCPAGPAGTIRNDPEATLRSSLGAILTSTTTRRSD